MSKKNKTLVLVLLLAVVLLAAVPFLTLKDAEFGGSDDAGSVMVEEIHGEYEPWFTPVLEEFLGGGVPAVLCTDRNRRGDHRFLHGPSRRAEEVAE